MWAIMPIPRHRLVVVLIATSLCLNFLPPTVFAQELRPFESEASSPSHQTTRNNEDFDNSVISNPSGESRNRGTVENQEESTDDGEEADDEYNSSENEGEDSEDDGEYESENEEQEAQGTGVNPQYVLPDGAFSNRTGNETGFSYPDSNGSASGIIYRTTDLDTAATG